MVVECAKHSTTIYLFEQSVVTYGLATSGIKSEHSAQLNRKLIVVHGLL